MADDTDIADPTLRVISDTFMAQLDELHALEEQKRVTPMDDPAFADLARRVEEAARNLLDRAAQQATAAERSHDAAVESGSAATIVDLPADLTPARILAMWRDADRELASVEPGSARAIELTSVVAALRRAYQRAYERQV